MGYEGSCRKFEELCEEVGAAEANRMLDDDPFRDVFMIHLMR